MFTDVALCDGYMHVGTIYITETPQALQRVTDSSVATVESENLSLYGICSTSRGLTMRKQISEHANSNLLCMDVNTDGNDIVTAAGGVERVVHVIDVRAGLNARDRWARLFGEKCADIAFSSTATSESGDGETISRWM